MDYVAIFVAALLVVGYNTYKNSKRKKNTNTNTKKKLIDKKSDDIIKK